MHRRISTVLFILVISLFVVTPVYAAKSYYAERFDVQIELQEDGSALITETVEFQFIGDPFTFVFREISARNTDGIMFLEASMDGNPMPQGTQAGQVEVETGDPLKVTWHFAPTSNRSHTFVVRYRAEGVIRKGDADTLIWRAIPEEHEYQITRSTITLIYPSEARPVEDPTLGGNFDTIQQGNRIILTAGDIAEDEDLILTARFAPGSLTDTAPLWQTRSEQMAAATARALPIGFTAGMASLILGGLGLLTYARAQARELNIPAVISNASPPSDLAAAIAGKLTRQGHTFIGTIFDLAQRGALEIQQEKGLLGVKTYKLVPTDQATPLQPYEQALIDALFGAGQSSIHMNEIGGRLSMQSAPYEEQLEQELLQRGWLDPARKHKRTRLTVRAVVMIVASLIVFVVSIVGAGMSLDENAPWLPWLVALAGISVGLFILSIAFLIYAQAYSILTPAGEEQAARWKGFAEYLNRVSKGREPAIRPDYFERYLPYAAVFGLGTSWAKYFQNLGGVPLPVWFQAAAGSHADFGAMVAILSVSDSAGTGAGGAAGAASGGGSSGAG
jgi:uncharacterized protein (TIGR04222 family)